MIEAWAHHRPVLATDAAGPAELIEDGVTGRLVPIGQPDALANALSELAADPDVLKAMAAAGHARLQANFTEARIVERYRALYQRLVDG